MKALFRFDEEGNVIIDRVEVFTVDSFKSILFRDKNSGTSGGKAIAFKELAYVWFMGDYASPIYTKGLTGAEAHSFACNIIGMPKDWMPDDLVKKAISDFKKLNSNAFSDVIADLIATFRYYGKIVNKVKKSIENQLEDKAVLTKDQAGELVSLMQVVLSISKTVPTEIKSLNETVKELREEKVIKQVDLLRGTEDAVPDSAEPLRDY
jgi:hypothetical protein